MKNKENQGGGRLITYVHFDGKEIYSSPFTRERKYN
jgi:hypothetical protein